MDDLDLAKLASAAYDPTPTWSGADVFAYATAVDAATTVVAFRGSLTIDDWAHDFDALPKHDPDLGFCHQGFLDNVRSVAAPIMQAMLGRQVIVTGHSKGGAEAQLLAALFVKAGRPPLQLSTFGAPRIEALGNYTVTALLEAVAGVDYRHRDDPVPDVPLGFNHPRSVFQLQPPRLEIAVIADHFISSYITALQPPAAA